MIINTFSQIADKKKIALHRPFLSMAFLCVMLLLTTKNSYSIVNDRSAWADIESVSLSVLVDTSHLQEQSVSRENTDARSLWLGGFFGLMVVMAVYNLLLYFSLRDKAYLLYVFVVIFNILTTLAINGLGEEYLWSSYPGIDAQIYITFAGISMAFSSRFTAIFLKLKDSHSRLNSLMWIIAGLSLLMSFLSVLMPLDKFVEFARWLVLLSFPTYIFTGIISYRGGFKPAFFYIVAWLPYILGIVIRTMNGAGWLPTNILTTSSIEIGGALEIVLLSFALADRIKGMRKELTEKELEKEQFKTKLLEEQKVVLEQKVDERTQELQRANATKDKFFSIIAHDLRSPMIGLQGVGQKLEYFIKKDKQEKLLDMGGQIDRSIDQLNHLLNNLLNWASTEMGDIPYNPVNVNLKELVEENIELYESLAKSKGIGFDIHLAEVEANLDINTTSTVIRNLLSNAIKFSPHGDDVQIKLNKTPTGIELLVKDMGPGMSYEVRNAVMHQGRTITKNGSSGEKGFGLGLKLCNEFIRLNKGELVIQSLPNQGTEMYVRFPLNGTEH